MSHYPTYGSASAWPAIPPTYTDPSRVKLDASSLLSRYPSLAAAVGAFSGYSSNNNNSNHYSRPSSTVQLFYIYGTLPIYFQGASYNVPIAFYLDPQYPSQPPRCFVTPTATMAILEGHRNVDSRGYITSPYLAGWDKRHSNLERLAATLTEAFSLNPPMYAKSPPPLSATTPLSSGTVAYNTSQYSRPQSSPLPNPTTASSYGQYHSTPALSGYPPAHSPYATGTGWHQATAAGGIAGGTLTVPPASYQSQSLGVASSPVDGGYDSMMRLQADLQSLNKELEEQLTECQRKMSERDKESLDLEARIKQAEDKLAQAENDKLSDCPGQLFTPSSPLEGELMEAEAEDTSYEDLYKALGDSLGRKAITLDHFLEMVRESSRLQFYVRKRRLRLRENLKKGTEPSALSTHTSEANAAIIK